MQDTIANMSLRDLLRKKEEAEFALVQREPLLFKEYQLLLAAIEQFDRTPDKPYSAVKHPRAAILLCLQRNGKWMTRKQIRRDLELGGFMIPDPEAFDNLLAAALRYHTKTGKLARRTEDGIPIQLGKYKPNTRFRNERYGLAEWSKNPEIGEFSEIAGQS